MSSEQSLASPCRTCGCKIFWQDRQVGNVHCAGCLEPPAASVAAAWFHMELSTKSEPDLFDEKKTVAQRIWTAVEFSPRWNGDDREDGDRESTVRSNRNTDRRSDESLDANMPIDHNIASQELTDAVMWFIAKRLSGEIAVTRGGVAFGVSGFVAMPSNMKPPKGAVEFFMLSNRRIIEGAKAATKFKSIVARTWEGAEQWYRVEQKPESQAADAK